MAKKRRIKQRRPSKTVASPRIQIQAKERKSEVASTPVIPGPWQTNAITFLLLVVATVALYIGDLRLGFFAVDDPQYVVDNPWIRGVTFENLRHILTTSYFANYSPLHLFSYTLDYVLAGPNPFAFHLSSNVWAGVVAGFVFLLALALTRNRMVAIASAGLFIVHPAHVEAIAWISNRKDLVAAAFALPSLLAYLRYRQGGSTARRWYVASLLLFLCAVAGKLSVATFPAVFLAHDLFVERRRLSQSLWDKVPFVVGAGLIALPVAAAQPSMGNRPDPYVLTAALVQNVWLLTGFGQYVIYRVPPSAAAQTVLGVAAILFLIAVFAAPLLFRKRSPITVVLLYWVLFAMIPAQVLSFSHPVTDRYLFFASVAVVILIGWGVFSLAARWGRRGLSAAMLVVVLLGVLWGRATFAYVAEWSDPRSVWYASASKSSDPNVSQNLGTYYQQLARRLGTAPQGTPLSTHEARHLAELVWTNDPRLQVLIAEWDEGKHGGLMEQAFQEDLRSRAWAALERSLRSKRNRVMPGLYYNRGLVLLDRGDLEGAKKEFAATLDEVQRETFVPVRQQLTVYCHFNLGTIAWKTGDLAEALRWFRMAEDEQKRFGANWIPNLNASRQKLEAMAASSSSP